MTAAATKGTLAPALAVRDLRKYYAEVRAVDGLDLVVAPGECFGLLGPNGAGKTTTIEICEGLLSPDAGQVELLGLRWDHAEHGPRSAIAPSALGSHHRFQIARAHDPAHDALHG